MPQDAFVTIKLSVSETQVVLESLKERQKLLEEHGKLKSEPTQGSRERIRTSRAKAIHLKDIINKIEG